MMRSPDGGLTCLLQIALSSPRFRAGDITAKLTLREHAGRREYWFGGLEITDEWLRDRFAESVRVADKRYTPQADAGSFINVIIDAAASGPTFLSRNFTRLPVARPPRGRASACGGLALRQCRHWWTASTRPTMHGSEP